MNKQEVLGRNTTLSHLNVIVKSICNMTNVEMRKYKKLQKEVNSIGNQVTEILEMVPSYSQSLEEYYDIIMATDINFCGDMVPRLRQYCKSNSFSSTVLVFGQHGHSLIPNSMNYKYPKNMQETFTILEKYLTNKTCRIHIYNSDNKYVMHKIIDPTPIKEHQFLIEELDEQHLRKMYRMYKIYHYMISHMFIESTTRNGVVLQAEKNIEELRDQLTIEYNKLRRDEITNEILRLSSKRGRI